MLPVTVVIDSRRRPRQRQDTPSHLSDYLILCRPHPVLDGQGDWEHCLGAVSRQTVSIGTGRNPWGVSFYKACPPINTNRYFFLLPASDFPIFPSLATWVLEAYKKTEENEFFVKRRDHQKNCEPKAFLGKLGSRGSYHTKCDVPRTTRQRMERHTNISGSESGIAQF